MRLEVVAKRQVDARRGTHGAKQLVRTLGQVDTVVPVEENTDLLEKSYKSLGGSIKVIRKEGVGHHPHSLKDPRAIVSFVLDAWKNRGGNK